MKVVILCGGRGTRLSEETGLIPKPMVDIGGKPMLWHIMKLYSHYGYKNFILCLGHKAEIIKNYFLNYKLLNIDSTVNLGTGELTIHNTHEELDWTVTLANTGQDNFTGSRIKQIEKYIDGDDFMLTYGDGLADVNIKALVGFYFKMGKIATVTGVRPRSRFGELKIEGETVSDFNEKPTASQGYINGGFFVLNRKVFKYVTRQKFCKFESKPLKKLANNGDLAMYYHSGFWEGVDTVRELENMRELWAARKAPWKVW